MLATRALQFRLFAQNGQPFAGTRVYAVLTEVVLAPEGLVVPQGLSGVAVTDANGFAEIQVYSGISAKYNIAYFVDGCGTASVEVTVPSGSDPIDFGVLIASSEIDENASAIAVLQDYIDQEVANSISGGDPGVFFQTLNLFNELDTQAKRTTARQNLELNYIDGGTF